MRSAHAHIAAYRTRFSLPLACFVGKAPVQVLVVGIERVNVVFADRGVVVNVSMTFPEEAVVAEVGAGHESFRATVTSLRGSVNNLECAVFQLEQNVLRHYRIDRGIQGMAFTHVVGVPLAVKRGQQLNVGDVLGRASNGAEVAGLVCPVGVHNQRGGLGAFIDDEAHVLVIRIKHMDDVHRTAGAVDAQVGHFTYGAVSVAYNALACNGFIKDEQTTIHFHAGIGRGDRVGTLGEVVKGILTLGTDNEGLLVKVDANTVDRKATNVLHYTTLGHLQFQNVLFSLKPFVGVFARDCRSLLKNQTAGHVLRCKAGSRIRLALYDNIVADKGHRAVGLNDNLARLIVTLHDAKSTVLRNGKTTGGVLFPYRGLRIVAIGFGHVAFTHQGNAVKRCSRNRGRCLIRSGKFKLCGCIGVGKAGKRNQVYRNAAFKSSNAGRILVQLVEGSRGHGASVCTVSKRDVYICFAGRLGAQVVRMLFKGNPCCAHLNLYVFQQVARGFHLAQLGGDFRYERGRRKDVPVCGIKHRACQHVHLCCIDIAVVCNQRIGSIRRTGIPGRNFTEGFAGGDNRKLRELPNAVTNLQGHLVVGENFNTELSQGYHIVVYRPDSRGSLYYLRTAIIHSIILV